MQGQDPGTDMTWYGSDPPAPPAPPRDEGPKPQTRRAGSEGHQHHEIRKVTNFRQPAFNTDQNVMMGDPEQSEQETGSPGPPRPPGPPPAPLGASVAGAPSYVQEFKRFTANAEQAQRGPGGTVAALSR